MTAPRLKIVHPEAARKVEDFGRTATPQGLKDAHQRLEHAMNQLRAICSGGFTTNHMLSRVPALVSQIEADARAAREAIR